MATSVVHILIGFVVFSMAVTLIFGAASLVGEDYESDDFDQYSEFSSGYEKYADSGSKVNSTTRKIIDRISSGGGVISTGSDVIIAAVEGVKLFFGVVDTGREVSDKIVEDSGGLVNPIFGIVVQSIISVVLLVVVISMLMRFKPQT